MATFTVTTATDAVADDGQLSLREAIAQADASAGPDTIRFAPDLEGSTLRLAGGPLVLSGGVTVDGDADASGDRVTLDAHGASRVLEIAGGDADVALHGLGVTGGDAAGGTAAASTPPRAARSGSPAARSRTMPPTATDAAKAAASTPTAARSRSRPARSRATAPTDPRAGSSPTTRA
jgi:hypothetical protein